MESEDYEPLRDALDKLKLNDAALTYVPETSPALGFGFRCGCLGLLHLDIVQQRLEREYGLEILTTLPNTEYRAVTTGGKSVAVDTPAQLPDPSDLDRIESRGSSSISSHRPVTLGPSWTCAKTGAARSRRLNTWTSGAQF